MAERVRVWLPAASLELAKAEAVLAGVAVNVWLEDAAREHVGLARAVRAMEAREREAWGGWHPNDREDVA